MELVLAKKAGPCACCGDHCLDVEQLRDEDGQFYCLACCLIAYREQLAFIDERMLLNAY
jgi:hypothetical protein